MSYIQQLYEINYGYSLTLKTQACLQNKSYFEEIKEAIKECDSAIEVSLLTYK